MDRNNKIIVFVILLLIFLGSASLIIIQLTKSNISSTGNINTSENPSENELIDEIYQAVINKNSDTYRKYIDEGEDLSFALTDGKTLLEHLIKGNDIEYAQKLITNGFNLKKVDNNHIDTITSILSSYENNPLYDNIIETLLQQISQELNGSDSFGYSLLINAIEKNNQAIALEIINLLDDVDEVYNGETALTYACGKNYDNLNVITALVEKNADINYFNNDGYNCLMNFVQSLRSSNEILNYLLALPNINVNAVNDDNQTLMHLAVEYANITVLDKLLQNKIIDLTIKDNEGRTAKAYAQYLFDDDPTNEVYLEMVNMFNK